MPFLEREEWHPGSFTKNFTWGRPSSGLKQLHNSIRVGFGNEFMDVPREVFRERLKSAGRIDYIPANFFLFNRRRSGTDWLVADELVFQALSFPYTRDFDKLGLFAFLFSRAGYWKGARPYQRYPSLWASHYVSDRIGREKGWATSSINSDDIESFLLADPRYHAKGARKVATNLNYMLKLGRIGEFKTDFIERWWVDSLFLALDRLELDKELDQKSDVDSGGGMTLANSGFSEISGPTTLDKKIAIQPILALYAACGGMDRFSDDIVRERTMKLPDVQWLSYNDPQPIGAVERVNPRVLKSVPRSCAIIARCLGFDILTYEELENFNIESFVKSRTRNALSRLHEGNVSPIMSASDLDQITRGE